MVANSVGSRDGGLPHFFAQLRSEQRGRCLLDDLLMPALHRAFALEEVDQIPVLIAEDLELDVARGGEILFQEEAVIAES